MSSNGLSLFYCYCCSIVFDRANRHCSLENIRHIDGGMAVSSSKKRLSSACGTIACRQGW